MNRNIVRAAILAFLLSAVLSILWSHADAEEDGTPVSNGARYMLIDEVKPGMKGYGLTVFDGTKIERFDAEIISVIYGFFVYRHWAFVGFAERSVLLQVRDYVLVNIVGSVVTVVVALILQRILIQFLAPSVVIDSFCHAVGIGVGALANYLGHKHFTFRA